MSHHPFLIACDRSYALGDALEDGGRFDGCRVVGGCHLGPCNQVYGEFCDCVDGNCELFEDSEVIESGDLSDSIVIDLKFDFDVLNGDSFDGDDFNAVKSSGLLSINDGLDAADGKGRSAFDEFDDIDNHL